MDVAVRPSGDSRSVDYDETGVTGLVEGFQALAAALPVAVVNPRQVRDFARATDRLSKTDARDAQVLAHFAEEVRQLVRQLRDDDAHELSAMTTRRNQVTTMLVAERDGLRRATPSVHPSIQAHIAWLEQELRGLDDGPRQTLRRSPVWREKDDLLGRSPAWEINSHCRSWRTCPNWAR